LGRVRRPAVPRLRWQTIASRTSGNAPWHRVERDIARFVREIEELRRQGWRDA
jgi:hypothetical protein